MRTPGAYALALPLSARYDAAAATAYLPHGRRGRAVPSRPAYGAAGPQAVLHPCPGRRGRPAESRCSLPRPRGCWTRTPLATEANTAVRMTAVAVEAWLAGVLAAGAEMPGV